METVTEEEYLSTLGVVEIWDINYNYCILIVNWELYNEHKDQLLYAVFDGLPLEIIMKLINGLGITHSVVQSGNRNYIDYNNYDGHEQIWGFAR